MLNINSKLQTLFATGGGAGGAIIPARQSVARLPAVLFVVISAMFILTGCGLGSLIRGDIPCSLNPFQEGKCYPAITVQAPDEKEIRLTSKELATLTEEQLAERQAEIDEQNAAIRKRNAALLAERERQLAARQAALAALAPVRKKLIDPVVAECTTNSVAEHCRNAFVWCSNYENTNSDECTNAVGADTGLFACLTDPYRDECEDEPALKEQISGQVVVRDEETGDVVIDEETGEEVTKPKTVSLLENTIQARINYCRSDNDAGVPNIEANAVLCDSTVREVCEDTENPAGVFDVFCVDDPDTTDYADARLEIATACRDDETPTVAEGCTSVVVFCNETPFGNPNCDIPAFALARVARVGKCIRANTVDLINECRVEGANNPCFGDPFIDGTDGVNCADPLNMGSTENVEIAQQSRATLCVNAFIAKTYKDVCGRASKTSCVMNPFGDTCAVDLGAGHKTAQQTRARYCIVGDRTADPLCSGSVDVSCMQNPYGTTCADFFGTTKQGTNAQRFRTNHCEEQITAGTATTDDLCDSYLSEEIACVNNPFRASSALEAVNCAGKPDYDDERQTIVDNCKEDSTIPGCTSNFINTCINNPFARFRVSATDNNLIPDEQACGALHFASIRLNLVDECRAGTRTEGCDSHQSIALCNGDPFADYRVGSSIDEEYCAGVHFDGARADKITSCLANGASGCQATFRHPNAAAWAKSLSDNSTPLVALDTSTPKNQFLLGTADGIPTTGTTGILTTLTIENDAKNGVGFFAANSKFYAGLFNGANLGEPLNDAVQAGEWTGNLRAVVGSSATLGAVLPMTLNVVYTGNTRTIKAFVPVVGETYFLLDGNFTEFGVISGTVNYGVFTGGVESASAAVTRGTNGILTGIIGQDGALGAFHSDEDEDNGYAGGFVAKKTTE